MKKSRSTFTSAYKVKIALQALKEPQTTSELAQKYQLSPNQINNWKKDFLSMADSVFDNGKTNQKELEEMRQQQDLLYRGFLRITPQSKPRQYCGIKW